MTTFFLDENVALSLIHELRLLCHKVTSVVEERLTGASDPLLMLIAAEREWTLITHNRRDFLLLHDAWHRWNDAWGCEKTHGGILILGQARNQTGSMLALMIMMLLADPAVVLPNACHQWTVSAGWRKLNGH